jgi:hypothetical protein
MYDFIKCKNGCRPWLEFSQVLQIRIWSSGRGSEQFLLQGAGPLAIKIK